MKKLVFVLVLFCSVNVLAQDKVDENKVDEKTNEQKIAALQTQVKEIQAGMQSMVTQINTQIQALVGLIKAGPLTEKQQIEQIKQQRKVYFETCRKQGLWFGGIDMDSKTGAVTHIRCSAP